MRNLRLEEDGIEDWDDDFDEDDYDDFDEDDNFDDEDDDDDKYDASQPISIFNHPPFSQMTWEQIRELEESWP